VPNVRALVQHGTPMQSLQKVIELLDLDFIEENHFLATSQMRVGREFMAARSSDRRWLQPHAR